MKAGSPNCRLFHCRKLGHSLPQLRTLALKFGQYQGGGSVEATGFQKVRARNALQIKLQAFIADELQDWARMFPEEFWFELARLEGVHYSARSRPLRWGKYVMLFVYDAIDADVGKELRKKNPSPRFLRNHHQWLKDFGRDKVHDQIQRVITIMKLCNNMDEFREKFARVFKKSPIQLSLFDFDFSSRRTKEAAN